MKHLVFATVLTALTTTSLMAFAGNGEVGSVGKKPLKNTISCISAQGTVIKIQVKPVNVHTDFQTFQDGVIIFNGKSTKVFVDGNSPENIKAITRDGKQEFSLADKVQSEYEAGETLDGGGVMAYNAYNAREDYQTLSKNLQAGEVIVMSFTKARGLGIYELPHLLKCSGDLRGE